MSDLPDAIFEVSSKMPSPLLEMLRAHGIGAEPGPDGFYVWREFTAGEAAPAVAGATG